jgi:hypothetical protein
MKLLTICITILFLLSGFVITVSAKDDKQHSGVETSTEHKSEQGLEHGEAYAGSKEKKAQDEEADDEEEDEEAVSGNGNDDKEDKTKGKKSN